MKDFQSQEALRANNGLTEYFFTQFLPRLILCVVKVLPLYCLKLVQCLFYRRQKPKLKSSEIKGISTILYTYQLSLSRSQDLYRYIIIEYID